MRASVLLVGILSCVLLRPTSAQDVPELPIESSYNITFVNETGAKARLKVVGFHSDDFLGWDLWDKAPHDSVSKTLHEGEKIVVVYDREHKNELILLAKLKVNKAGTVKLPKPRLKVSDYADKLPELKVE